ncbi:DUF1761 domain-containing protein [Leptospira brenneri]|uniref:DUF1761 domain-containing protein n=1 Tax=Leptospira brenneri TaxID=2023182 RepID=A0A2M9Y6V9_9LEPT|nr:DUF1761 domain-containing protein [Leptospira brenneri]PJZ47318.1 hypothetical protein CH361_03030 [Leptospira brenneri]TGK95715.1 DUF1761 domain-containing protein [Leptospira brenneri]
MLESLFSLNWIAIVLAILVYSFLGFIWFTILLKRLYRISLGKENETEQPPNAIFILGPMVCIIVITITTAILFSRLEIDQTIDALAWGSFIGIGYLSANTMNIAINPNIPKPILYGVISSTYHLVGINLVSLLLVQKF